MPTSVRSGEFLAGCTEILSRSLQRAGVDCSKAEAIARGASDQLRQTFGGSNVYVARGRTDAKARAAEFHTLRVKGVTVKQIAIRKGVSESYVWRLLARETERLAKSHKVPTK